MTEPTITLPRAVVEQMRLEKERWETAVRKCVAHSDGSETEWGARAVDAFEYLYAALDAALAEPEKERAEVAAPARGVGTGQTNALTGEAYRTPEPDAKREPATEKQVAEVFKLSGAVYWGHYRDGWRAAERHHGITKEDK